MKFSYFLLLLFIGFNIEVNGKPTTRDSLVLRLVDDSSKYHQKIRARRETSDYIPKIKSLHINSNVSLRFANTTITSNIQNSADETKEVTFSVLMPDTAFISGFIMKLDDKEYEAYVKEKKEAKRIYDEAVTAGITAAHVATEARDSNHFTVSINLESAKKAEFRLKYEELLVRKNGVYELEININPKQLIDDMSVDVDINEVDPLSFVTVPLMSSGNEVEDLDTTDKTDNPFTTTSISEDRHSAKIHFSPSKAEQTELMATFKAKQQEPTTQRTNSDLDLENNNPSDSGISGQFVVQYDVETETNGKVLINDGFFVHFFTPETLKPLNKYVLFVLDISGSMYGQKMSQLKIAMKAILSQLKRGDTFNIITFGSSEKVYKLSSTEENMPTKVNTANIDEAKTIIEKIDDNGMTNMESGLAAAFRLIEFASKTNSPTDVAKVTDETKSNLPMIIFLSDGDANMGKTGEELVTYTKQLNEMRVPIYSLAFGRGANRDYLKKLSLKNYGFMKPIYDASDASKQLKNFFKTVSSPLLTNVQYEYPKDQMEDNSITQKKFDHFFSGSSMVVVGKVKDTLTADDYSKFKVIGQSNNGSIDFYPTVKMYPEKVFPMERLWAYLTIKQMMDERERNEEKKDEIDKKALEIALRYKFVTPVTSLVVVKPNATTVSDPQQSSPDLEIQTSGSGSRLYALSLPMPVPRSGVVSHNMPMPMSGYSSASSSRISSNWMSGSSSDIRFSPRPSYSYHPGQRPMSVYPCRGCISNAMAGPPPRSVYTSRSSFGSYDDTDSDSDSDILGNDLLTTYGLENFSWIASHINNNTKSFTLKLGYRTKTFSLKYKWEDKQFTNFSNCNNAVGFAVGSGKCQYLTSCKDIVEGFGSLRAYERHYCDIEGYAGLCCKDSSVI